MVPQPFSRWLRLIALGLILGAAAFWWRMDMIGSERLNEVRARVAAPLKGALEERGLRYGAPIYLRVFKESMELELWVEADAGRRFEKFKTYRIANHSGTLGPKQREGDMQAPEGFYATTQRLLNPMSNFHLSFNIGYPNECDQQLGRTGSLIMVHGSNVSVGCFAMTDPVIEEIYLIVEASLKDGQKEIPVHVFPFRLTDERLAQAAGSEWRAFWCEQLKPAYDAFEKDQRPPQVTAQGGRYLVKPSSPPP